MDASHTESWLCVLVPVLMMMITVLPDTAYGFRFMASGD